MNDYELAWAAGFLDGEGYFGAVKGNGLSKRTYRLVITASQTGRRAPCEKLQELFGGVVQNLSRERSGTGATSHSFRWSVDGAPSIKRVVPLILPHLIVKKREAELLLELANMVRPRGTKGPPGYTPDQIDRMDMLATAIKQERTFT